MILIFLLTAENPQEPASEPGRDLGRNCISVRENDEAVVFRMFGHVIDDGLEIGSSPAIDLDLAPGFRKGQRFAQLGVKGHDIDLLHTIFEKAVDGGKEILQVFLRNGTAHIDRYQIIGPQLPDAAHILEAAATVGAHPGKAALGAEHTGTEARQHLSVIQFWFEGCLNLFYEITRQ